MDKFLFIYGLGQQKYLIKFTKRELKPKLQFVLKLPLAAFKIHQISLTSN